MVDLLRVASGQMKAFVVELDVYVDVIINLWMKIRRLCSLPAPNGWIFSWMLMLILMTSRFFSLLLEPPTNDFLLLHSLLYEPTPTKRPIWEESDPFEAETPTSDEMATYWWWPTNCILTNWPTNRQRATWIERIEP